MPLDPAIAAIIDEASQTYGIPDGYLGAVAMKESGGNPNAQARGSSAGGLFQFIDSTADSYDLTDKFNPRQATDAAARLTRDNMLALQKAGYEASPGSLYLSHFAGPQGAINVLGADPSASVASVLGQKAVAANPFLGRMSAGDLTNWASQKMGGAGMTMPQQAGGPARPAGFGPAGPQQQAYQEIGPLTRQPLNDSGGYSDIAALLRGVSGAQGPAQAQPQQQTPPQEQASGPLGGMGGPAPSLDQARASFDPSRFFNMLPRPRRRFG